MSRPRQRPCLTIWSILRRLRAVLVACAWLGVCPGLAGAAGESYVPISAALLHEDEFCLGCHGAASHAEDSPLVEQAPLQASAHEGLRCSECHFAITTVSHRAPTGPVDCTRCHSGDTKQASLKAQAGEEAPLDQHSDVTQHGASGLPKCVDCHGAHDVNAVSDVGSHVGRKQVAATCGTCHEAAAEDYRDSVHGSQLLADSPDVPTCITCHPEHARLGESGVFQEGVVETCGECHANAALQDRYALPGDRLASYLGSYHGIATGLGDVRTANCASCHGSHLILPTADPRSATNPANLPQTCGKCHPNVNENVTRGKIHILPTSESGGLVYQINLVFKWLTFCVIGALVGHICLELFARARGRVKGVA